MKNRSTWCLLLSKWINTAWLKVAVTVCTSKPQAQVPIVVAVATMHWWWPLVVSYWFIFCYYMLFESKQQIIGFSQQKSADRSNCTLIIHFTGPQKKKVFISGFFGRLNSKTWYLDGYLSLVSNCHYNDWCLGLD